MILKNKGYCYNDLSIVPAIISEIKSRSECNPFLNDNVLPIFASPMSTVTNEYNSNIWKNNGITPIIPRTVSLEDRLDYIINKCDWAALSLKEFTEIFCNDYPLEENKTYKVCVDLANGHMHYLYEQINKAKELSRKRNYKLIIMTGNIANPETYEWICSNAEVDYIRLSIGSGATCITSTQTSIHYPIATLISKCNETKLYVRMCMQNNASKYYETGVDNYQNYKSCPYIVADGGIRGYADVIKALGLGADYVMIGTEFTKLFESAGLFDMFNDQIYNLYYLSDDGYITTKEFNKKFFNVWDSEVNEDIKRNFMKHNKIVKKCYGMSTKIAQKMINPEAKTKTSEGCVKTIESKETVKQWTDNMISYLKSAMSYTSKRNIKDFIGNVNFIINSNNTYNSVNK